MLLGIAGVTGVGKSYYKDKIVEQLGFEKVKIITNRARREGEKNNEDKIFVNEEELQEWRNSGKLAYEFNLLGYTYAYTREELFSDKNMVFELHYDTIYEFKEVCPHLKTIYIFPGNIEEAKKMTRERHLKQEVETARLLEIDEHYKRITTDEKLRNMFDHVLYNNYDKESEEKIIECVKKMIMK